MIKLGDEVHIGAGRRLRVLAVVPFEEEDESPFVGLLKVEAGIGNGRSGEPNALALAIAAPARETTLRGPRAAA
jgi:hypothetical protein